jgi:putative nucleotidyltransferase with HDIG domain
MDRIDQYIERVRHLPPATQVVSQLLTLLNDPNRDLERIVELINYDPSLAAEVLKRCNSAFFRGAVPAADISEAVTRLGFTEAYCVVVALVGAQTLALVPARSGLDAGRLWQHSVTTAVAAEALTGLAQENETTAFTAGLLHDIGKLVFASVEESAYAKCLAQAGTFGPALLQAEEVAFGATHAAVGGRLLTRWGLPTSVTLTVSNHHHSPRAAASFERMAAIVQLANSLAHYLEKGEAAGSLSDLATDNAEALTLLDLTEEDLPGVIDQIQERLHRVQRLLRITG